MRKSIKIYREWWVALRTMSPELRLKALDALFAYGFDGEQPADEVAQAITAIMLNTVDRDNARQDAARERNRRYRAKVRQARANQNAPAKQQSATTLTQAHAAGPAPKAPDNSPVTLISARPKTPLNTATPFADIPLSPTPSSRACAASHFSQ